MPCSANAISLRRPGKGSSGLYPDLLLDSHRDFRNAGEPRFDHSRTGLLTHALVQRLHQTLAIGLGQGMFVT